WSDRSQAFLRTSTDRNRTIAPGAVVGMPSNWQSLRNNAMQVQAGLISVPSASLVHSLRTSYSYLIGQLKPISGVDCGDALACIGVGEPNVLVFDASQFRIGNQVNSPFPRWLRTWQLVDDVTWQHGRHLVRAGAEWEHVYWKASWAFNDPAQLTLWGPSNLQT